uniref:NADH-ubiquinone oxidoreductase chain 2 n=1 Tax=Daubentonia madagascariensis TaxID=31869 RepID=A0A0A7DFT4_DAUMA|nr:NADH dehydrogenase subunit 2 [Daubentonia madagascariensis]AII98662.1 NADH dehydrogenase subunit 2 [Daubentonia madagascariensis]AII98675.1 NADH dehydrogenase subunit 2 [Daubentonia madagascariensis]AII98688.1 NADH dehydrogenase subunit 2 [Daubentonia madagascariensis]
MKIPITTLILISLFMGTMLTMIGSHWFLIWAGLEINMLTIIPLMTKKTNPRSTEAATKYFLTQATASMLLMMAIIINVTNTGQWSITKNPSQLTSTMMTIALAMKLGLAPFHFWVPEVTQGSPLFPGMILLSWQKLAPISIMLQMYESMNLNMMLALALLSILIGGWGGLNQTQLRKILAYSSIAHMGWMTTILMYNPSATILNLTIYLMLTITTFSMFYLKSNTTTLMLARLWNKNPMMTTMMFATLLSLGGLPPLTGFLPKWIIIQELTKNDNIIFPALMTMMTLLSLYFYMRLTYSTSLTSFPTTNNMKMMWRTQTMKKTPFLYPLITVSTLALPLSPTFATLS